MTDQLPMVKELTIDYKRTWNLYTKQTTSKNRVKRQFTITPETDEQWKDFVTTNSGVEPTRGKGVSSALVELSMRVLMNVITGFKLEEIATELKKALTNPTVILNVAENLRHLARALETPLEEVS